MPLQARIMNGQICTKRMAEEAEAEGFAELAAKFRGVAQVESCSRKTLPETARPLS